MIVNYLLLILLLGMLLVGVPVAYVLIFVAVAGLYVEGGVTVLNGILTNATSGVSSSFTFATIPMFILMAEFIRNCGLSEDIFEALNLWLNKIPGGLAIATVFANGMLAVMSGSSTANAAAVSKVAIPEFRNYNYSEQLAVGTVTGSGTFASMLPPSIGLILYGLITETSIARLFIAGIVPGVLTLGLYLVVIWIWFYVNPDAAGRRPTGVTWSARFSALSRIWTAALLGILVLGGLYGGLFTATEAGAVGAIGALLIAIQMRMDREGLYEALQDTLETTTMIFMLLIGATLFSRWMALSGIAQMIVEWVASFGLGRLGFLLVLILLFLVLGMFMSQLVVLVVAVPILLPVVTQLGIDSIWFGIFMIKTIEMALVTPPFGVIIFIVSGAVDVDTSDAFKGAARFLVADFVVLLLIIAFPDIVLTLPRLMG